MKSSSRGLTFISTIVWKVTIKGLLTISPDSQGLQNYLAVAPPTGFETRPLVTKKRTSTRQYLFSSKCTPWKSKLLISGDNDLNVARDTEVYLFLRVNI